MGCDIHVYIEKYNVSEKIWEYVPKNVIEPYGDRSYLLFAKLASVRNYSETIVPISEPRGMPQDCSKQWKNIAQKWGIVMHSHTYLFGSELDLTLGLNPVWDSFVEKLLKLSDDPNHIRIVFGFDN